MKVYCRFAPCASNVSLTQRSLQGAESTQTVEDVPLLLQVKELANEPSANRREDLCILDPVSGSTATFTCDGVFLPFSLRLQQGVHCGGNGVSRYESHAFATADSEQEALYDRTCSGFLSTQDGIVSTACDNQSTSADASQSRPRNVCMAYGQTSSGKTYSLFGLPPPTNSRAASERMRHYHEAPHWAWWEAQLHSPTAGVVPRYINDIFSNSGGNCNAYVVLSCFEIYNEVTTDLVAIATQPSKEAEPRKSGRGSNNNESSRTSCTSFSRLCSDTTDSVMSCELSNHYSCSPVGECVLRYDQYSGSGARTHSRTTFKATEKGQVLRSLRRARCTTAVECWVVVCELLGLRQRCQTHRNASSSRGHFVLQLEVSAGKDGTGSSHETVFVDLAGSESSRGAFPDSSRAHSATGRSRSLSDSALSGGTSRCSSVCSSGGYSGGKRRSASVRSSRHPHLPHAATPLTNAAKIQADVDAAAAKRAGEMRHINSSLLALRKVIHAFHVISQSSRQAVSGRLSPSTAAVVRHVPFKDSALTTVLEPFLLPNLLGAAAAGGGNASPRSTGVSPRVVLLVCCSPRQTDFHETVSSLRMGAEASTIQASSVRLAIPPREPTRRSSRQERRHSHASSDTARLQSEQPTFTSANGNGGFTAAAPPPPVRVGTSGEDSTVPTALLEELRRLRREKRDADLAKTRLQEQFAKLCKHYGECVEELDRSRRAIAERDATIAALMGKPVMHADAGDAGVSTLCQNRGGSVPHSDWSPSADVVVSPTSNCPTPCLPIKHGEPHESAEAVSALTAQESTATILQSFLDRQVLQRSAAPPFNRGPV